MPRATGKGYLVNSEGVASFALAGQLFAINELRELWEANSDLKVMT